jgi:hypothetical protein
MEQILVELVAKYPVIASIIGVVGVFRLVFKPAVSFARTVVTATPTKKDDEVMDKVEASGVYKGIVWVVDYLTSIKLPGAK